MSTATQWRYVAEDDVSGGTAQERTEGAWLGTRSAATDAIKDDGVDDADPPFDRIYLERREVTYSDPVRVELSAADGESDDAL